MKRETRVNFWFLAIFVALSLPGAVILFRKKLKPEARPIFMTDEVERRLPYMAPEPTPPGFRRVIPPRTVAFIDGMARAKGGDVRLLSNAGPEGQRLPVLSADRQLQALAVGRAGEKIFLALVAWSGPTQPASIRRAEITFKKQEGTTLASVQSASAVALPEPVFRELMNFGYIAPPRQVGWIELEIPPTIDVKEIQRIILERQDGERTIRQSVEVSSSHEP